MRNFIFSFLALILLPAYMSGQVIKGKILDETGNSLPGVNITAASSNTNSISDFEGNFSIEAQEGEQLQFSYLGYQTATAAAANGMSVSMNPDSTDLSEVIVVGYGTQKKADVTGSIGVVNEKELRDRPNANVVSSLQGKIAGVVVNNSGKPGESPNISIRGIGSITGNQVLYVVDGVMTDNITYLSPSDIATMSVLKDASSSAIYGIRAANGVVVIATKLGRKGGAENIKFSYDTNIGFSNPTNIPDLAGASDYIRLYNQKLDYEPDNVAPGDPDPDIANYLDPADFSADTDWLDEILRKTSYTQSHNISMTGASEKTQYSIGLGYFTQEGVINNTKSTGIGSGDDYKRITARFNGIYDVTDRFRVGTNMAYYKFDSNDAPTNLPIYQAMTAVPIMPVFNDDGSYASLGNIVGTQAGNVNPRLSIDNFRGKTKGTRTLLAGFGEFDIIKNKELTFRLSYSRDFSSVNNFQYTREFTPLGSVTVTPSKLINRNDTGDNVLWENTLTWTKSFDKHRITALLGYSREQRVTKALRASAENVPFDGDDSTLFLNLGTSTSQEPILAREEGSRVRFQSYFGRVQYAFDDKYLINATVRRDGASAFNFDGSQKSATFPSVGLGWIVSEESFMANSKINFLKFKASWGKLGNATVTRQFDLVATPQAGAVFGTPSQVYNAISVTQLVDPSISWEKVSEYDFGFELRTFDNRMSLEAGYYDRETSDAVFRISIPSQAGLGSDFLTNAGSFKNKGIEISATWTDKVNDKFEYSIYGNLTTIDNEVTEVLGGSFLNTGPGIAGEAVKRWQVGGEVGAYYGYNVVGVVQTEEESAEYGAPVGALRFEDRDGNGVIDAGDKTFLGSPIPEITYGFGVNLAYSGVDLGVEFQGVAGNEIYNFNRNIRFANENWDQDFADNAWSPTNPTNSYPAPNSDQSVLRPNSFFVEKGDYFRVRNVQLGYTLPKTFLEKIKIDRLRIYISAQNPFTSFKYNGFSPELGKQNVENMGIDNNVYPLSAVYSFGINLNF